MDLGFPPRLCFSNLSFPSCSFYGCRVMSLTVFLKAYFLFEHCCTRLTIGSSAGPRGFFSGSVHELSSRFSRESGWSLSTFPEHETSSDSFFSFFPSTMLCSAGVPKTQVVCSNRPWGPPLPNDIGVLSARDSVRPFLSTRWIVLLPT